MDVEAQDDGVLAKIILGDGNKNVPIGTPIAILGEQGDDISGADALANESESSQPQPQQSEQQTTSSESSSSSNLATEVKDIHPSHSKPIFPSVLRLLIENGIEDAGAIKGTGRHGMLTRGDVLAHIGKIDNPRGSMQKLVQKVEKQASEFKPFEKTQEAKKEPEQVSDL